MGGPSIFAAAPLLLFLLVIPAVAAAIAFVFGRRSRVRGVREACCAVCLYRVRGLQGFVCPECGSDVRERGILTPAMRRPLNRWAGVLLWTLALPIPCVALTFVFLEYLAPVVQQDRRTLDFMGPQSRAYDSVHLTWANDGVLWPWERWNASRASEARAQRLNLALHLMPPGATIASLSTLSGPLTPAQADGWIEYDFAAERFRVAKPTGAVAEQAGPLAADHLLEWMRSLRIDTTRAAVEQEAAAIVAAIDERRGLPMIRLSQTTGAVPAFQALGASTSNRTVPLDSARGANLIFWLLVWLWGCRWFFIGPDRAGQSPHARGAAVST